MAHSTGPLTIHGPSPGTGPYDDGGDYAIVENGKIIGEAIHRVDAAEYVDAEANARLWAAAPRMFDTLSNLLGLAYQMPAVQPGTWEYEAIEEARELIAEIKGDECE